MYKLLLCVRYLQTRYLAFICIVSVMLGVATLIVVNAVMSGFSTKLKDRLHGVLSDVIVETDRPDGFDVVRTSDRDLTAAERDRYRTDPTVIAAQMKRMFPVEIELSRTQTPHALVVETTEGVKVTVRRFLTPEGIMHEMRTGPAGDMIEAVTPTIETFAILQFRYNGTVVAKPIRLIGVDPEGRAAVGGFSEYLHRQQNARKPSFDLTPDALHRHEWNVRQARPRVVPPPPVNDGALLPIPDPNFAPPQPQTGPVVPLLGGEPLLPVQGAVPKPDMQLDVGTPKSKLHGAIVGYSLAHVRYPDKSGQMVEEAWLKPGDDVIITTAGGQELRPVWGSFIVTDYLKTEMSEYDQSFVYVPLDQLQHIRGMTDRASAFQVKLKNYDRDKAFVSQELQKVFPHAEARVATWEEHQGPLLSAIEIERGILNLLLFMIVGVAGFSILAIFTMIVSEKYRDIGIMKSLGASSTGVMSIFLSYGLLLGTVGSLLGTGLGLFITYKINQIEALLTKLTGHAVFPRDIYYFKEIPTNIEPLSVVAVNLGAILIATVFSLLPAWRAARLHPVQALRFE